jgi:hypothetical protein
VVDDTLLSRTTSAIVSCSLPTFIGKFRSYNIASSIATVNAYLVWDLKAPGLWDEVMVSDLKYFDGSVGKIDRVNGRQEAIRRRPARKVFRLLENCMQLERPAVQR